ncbi:MerR family transcriptional regulator [Culicoidibacter larvae]|uniref:MerR family transcriptional regulator n=1 Tax=Culicoidibacter larvae TaxID=2579976 RepID=A0A5R8QI53_9FIRM|nr:MerR family transcriptional regulator [Culicoidibacter larvae]TLG77406.1 MerR family transcriptional regulator [Culicoidibacter larvae]
MFLMKEFSEQTGFSIDTLRYYEKIGLLKPDRNEHGYRIYSKRDLEWVAFIKKLKATQMPLAKIIEYSELRSAGEGTLTQRKALLIEHQEKMQKELAIIIDGQTAIANKIKFYEEMEKEQ